MPAPAAEMTIPVNVAATANHDRIHFDFEIVVAADGKESLRVYYRLLGTAKPREPQFCFDAYEIERFSKAFGECRELLAAIQERGATFKIG